MTVEYECIFNLKDYVDEDTNECWVTEENLAKAKAAVEGAGYNWYQEGDEIQICGEVDVDPEYVSADDIEKEIEWTLWNAGEIDADVDTREVEYEPDWDKMPGGYDYLYN